MGQCGDGLSLDREGADRELVLDVTTVPLHERPALETPKKSNQFNLAIHVHFLINELQFLTHAGRF